MITELLKDREAHNILIGTSMAMIAEKPEMSFEDAFTRSTANEGRTEDGPARARCLYQRALAELFPDTEHPTSAQSRAVLRHMLKAPPWNIGTKQHELP